MLEKAGVFSAGQVHTWLSTCLLHGSSYISVWLKMFGSVELKCHSLMEKKFSDADCWKLEYLEVYILENISIKSKF